jgi:hypothetical protein
MNNVPMACRGKIDAICPHLLKYALINRVRQTEQAVRYLKFQ